MRLPRCRAGSTRPYPGSQEGERHARVPRHPPARRNPFLAAAFQSIGLVNCAGLGVDRIYEELLRLGKGMPSYEADEGMVRLTLPTQTHSAFARFVATEAREGRRLDLDELIALRAVTERGFLDRWTAAQRLQLTEEEAAARLVALRERGYLTPQGRGRGTTYRFARHLSDLLQGHTATDRELPLDSEAVRLRVEAILAERGMLTNADVRRLSGLSRTEVLRLLRSMVAQGVVALRGRGRAAHYVPGPRIATAKSVRPKRK